MSVVENVNLVSALSQIALFALFYLINLELVGIGMGVFGFDNLCLSVACGQVEIFKFEKVPEYS